MTAAHSYWSASKFESLMLCPGKVVLEDGAPDNTSAYAAEGTAAHQVLTWALQEDMPASAYIGRVIYLDEHGRVCGYAAQRFEFEVTADMAEHVQTCVDYCLAARGDDGILFADIRVNYSSYLEVLEETAWGTADVIICRGDELTVVDFKYGRGVEVSAERNPQMSLYGLGALQAYQGLAADFSRVRMAISQPRLSKAPSEWDCSVEELETWARHHARPAVGACNSASAAWAEEHRRDEWHATFLRPAEKACKFCKAKATCPALREVVLELATGNPAPATPEEFNELTVSTPTDDSAEVLSFCLSKVDMVEDWCKAVRAEVERRLLAGDKVPGYKLVQGRAGARQWSDPKEAEKLLRETFRLPIEKAYDLKLISPTSAEKLAKAGDIGPRQWPKAQGLITRSEGKAHVAPESDPRPALVAAIDEFENLA